MMMIMMMMMMMITRCLSVQDVENHASIEEMTEQLGLLKMCCNRSWHLQGCSAKTGDGLADGLEWLSRQMVAAGAPELA